MKRIILTIGFITGVFTQVSWAEEDISYQGCGTTPDEARAELAKSLVVSVHSSVEHETQVSSNGFFSSVDSNTSVKKQQSTDIVLCSTRILPREDGQFCASVLQSELLSCAQNKLEQQLVYHVDKLPQQSALRLEQARQWHEDIVRSKGLYTVVGTSLLGAEKLQQLVDIEKALIQELNTQFVRFNIVGGEASISVDGDQQIQSNEDIALEIGRHSYLIEGEGTCPIAGEFELSPKEKVVVDVDLALHQYPVVTFTSNLAEASLLVDGDDETVGSSVKFDRCTGTVAYVYTYQEVTKTGQLTLRPGLRQTVYRGFTSQQMVGLVRRYKVGTYWQLQYDSHYLIKDKNGIDDLAGFRLSRLKLNDYFRSGTHISYTSGEDGSFAIDYSLSFRLQLLDFNNETSVLHLGPFAIMPHLGVEAGLSYRKLGSHNTFDSVDVDRMDRDFKRFTILRPSIGFDTTFNSGFAFTASFGRNLFINSENTFSVGMGFRF